MGRQIISFRLSLVAHSTVRGACLFLSIRSSGKDLLLVPVRTLYVPLLKRQFAGIRVSQLRNSIFLGSHPHSYANNNKNYSQKQI